MHILEGAMFSNISELRDDYRRDPVAISGSRPVLRLAAMLLIIGAVVGALEVAGAKSGSRSADAVSGANLDPAQESDHAAS